MVDKLLLFCCHCSENFVRNCNDFFIFCLLIGPILHDRLKEKLLKSGKGALCFHFRVCPSVRHTFWPRNLIFGLSDPWDMRKKTHFFLFFEIVIFTPFFDFRFFPYITLVNFCFQATGHSFSPSNVIFWPLEIKRLLNCFENSMFYG